MRILILLSLLSCGSDSYNLNSNIRKSTPQSCTVEGRFITCPDGSSIEVKNGEDGMDGQDSSVVTRSIVESGTCSQVYPNMWVENINGGEIFDVYYNDSCSDTLGEHCDNVQTAYGSSGTFGSNKTGNGTVCLANQVWVVGERLDDDSIEISVIQFN